MNQSWKVFQISNIHFHFCKVPLSYIINIIIPTFLPYLPVIFIFVWISAVVFILLFVSLFMLFVYWYTNMVIFPKKLMVNILYQLSIIANYCILFVCRCSLFSCLRKKTCVSALFKLLLFIHFPEEHEDLLENLLNYFRNVQ